MRAPRPSLPAALLLLLWGPACDLGMDPPAPTRLISIPGGTFYMGPPPLARNSQTDPYQPPLRCSKVGSEQVDRCDQRTGSTEALMAQLSWVPNALAKVSAFKIEEHEVTNRQYAFCVEMGACTPPAYNSINQYLNSAQTITTLYYGDPAFDDHPVVNVTHAQAVAYCESLGRRLPLESQWERAARLGVYVGTKTPWLTDEQGYELRTFPWKWSPYETRGSTTTDSPMAWGNCNSSSGRFAVFKEPGGLTPCSPYLPRPVRYSESDKTELQVRNMASNVAEWVWDGFQTYAYCSNSTDGYGDTVQGEGRSGPSCVSDRFRCAKTCETRVICKAGTYTLRPTGEDGAHVVRGGSYADSRCRHRLYVRSKKLGTSPAIGFRCSE